MIRRRNNLVPGFTLVEVLIVIAIIGVLMGLAVTGVNAARKAIQRRAIAMEVTTIAQAVEAYKQKYQSYPPDGSSLAAFRAHFAQVFPNMAVNDEIAALQLVAKTPNTNGIMDPAEALVFCLGGYSSDPTHPFTGKGGPLLRNGATWQYNVDRNEGFFGFAQESLTLNDTATASTDEGLFGTGVADQMPIYVPKGRAMPLVYFNSNTYVDNAYSGTGTNGGAKPLKSETINSSIPWTNNKDKHYRYMNDKTFQLISAGLDDDFGPVLSPNLFFTFPSGKLIDVLNNDAINNASSTGYNFNGGPSGALDNVTNFSEGALQDSLP